MTAVALQKPYTRTENNTQCKEPKERMGVLVKRLNQIASGREHNNLINKFEVEH